MGARAFDVGKRAVDEQFDGARENIERSGAVLALAHEDFAGAVKLARDSAWELLKKLVKRNKGLSAGVALALVVLLVKKS